MNDVANSQHVLLGFCQAVEGRLSLDQVDPHSGSFLDQGSPLCRAQAEGGIYQSLSDDGVLAVSQTSFAKDIEDVPQAHSGAVEMIFVLT